MPDPGAGEEGDREADGDHQDTDAYERIGPDERAGWYSGKRDDDHVHDQPDDQAIADTGEPGVASGEGESWVEDEKGAGEAESDKIMEEHAIYNHIGATFGSLWAENAAGDEAEDAGGLVAAMKGVIDDRARCIQGAGDDGGEEKGLPKYAFRIEGAGSGHCFFIYIGI